MLLVKSEQYFRSFRVVLGILVLIEPTGHESGSAIHSG